MIVLLTVPVVLVVGYLVTACAVFDFNKAAFPFNQQTGSDGRPVAFGPRPRPWAYAADKNWQGIYWQGKEWPFIVFAPVCSWWRHSHGYAAPVD